MHAGTERILQRTVLAKLKENTDKEDLELGNNPWAVALNANTSPMPGPQNIRRIVVMRILPDGGDSIPSQHNLELC